VQGEHRSRTGKTVRGNDFSDLIDTNLVKI
jgi:hypothetical protein